MNRIRNITKLVIALTWMFSASAWAVGGYVFDAAGDVSVAAGEADAQPAKKNDADGMSGALLYTR